MLLIHFYKNKHYTYIMYLYVQSSMFYISNMSKDFKSLFSISTFYDHFCYPKIWLGIVVKNNTPFIDLYTFHFIQNLKKEK